MADEITTGSCLCGAIKYSFTGQPVTRVLCHCLDCRKISGSHYSDNALLTTSQFSLLPTSSVPATFTIPANEHASEEKLIGPSGAITSHFCDKCGSTCWRTGEAFEGYVSVRVGTLDDAGWVERGRPVGEVWGERRVGWLAGFGVLVGGGERDGKEENGKGEEEEEETEKGKSV